MFFIYDIYKELLISQSITVLRKLQSIIRFYQYLRLNAKQDLVDDVQTAFTI